MDAFATHSGAALPLDRINVDTDQIIPARFLKKIDRVGFGELLFYAWRYNNDGSPNPDFILNDPDYAGATVLLAGENFGSGSSREHAPWALQQYGFRAIIAPSFADIFRNNCYQNGLLPVALSADEVAMLMRRAQDAPGYLLTVDLQAQTVSDGQGFEAHFDIDPFRRERLLQGLDDIGLTLQHADSITAFEAARSA
jgi:3-isopropylmalate/(R)-2-methylmalate dehydratase small subunit